MTQLIDPITNKPYYNTFDPLKLYQDILFKGGVNLQSRELNELISMLAYRVKRIGNTLYNDGSIVKGGSIIITGTTVKIEPTDVFISGIVHELPETNLSITTIGTEVLGVKLIQEIINYETDIDLIDPSPGLNLGRPGADRIKLTPEWAVNDPEAYPIYPLTNGNLNTTVNTPESDTIAAWLARRTNDESGSYTVSGLTAYAVEKDSSTMTLVMEAGKGYVQGWEINKPSPTKVDFLKSQNTKVIVNETKTYTGTADYIINSQPVKLISQLTAQVEKTITLTKGISGGRDTIPVQYQPVTAIKSIPDYLKDTDYVLNGNDVDWTPIGSEPAQGSTYSITFVYTKIMEQNVDYQLYYDLTISKYKVRFLDGDRPSTDSSFANFQYSYEFYLERRDIVYLTRDGNVEIIQGQSAVIAPLPPIPIGVLILCDLYVSPNSSSVIVNNYDPKRLTMQDLRNLKTRIDDMEYNAAIEDLDSSAQQMEPATTKRGVFTDGFLNLNKIDFGEYQSSCSIDPRTGTLMPAFTSIQKDPIVNSTGTARLHRRLVTKPYTEIVKTSQLNSTQLVNVNPYMVYNKTAIVSVTPNQDNWVETQAVTRIVYRWWDQWTGTAGTTSTTTSVATQLLLTEAVLTMRQRVLTVTGTSFLANSDNIKCTFDGIQVDLIPAGVGTAGTLTTPKTTMRANSNGEFTATFTIPPNIPVGTREIVIWNEV